MYRLGQGEIHFFLVHPGGPFFVGKDDGFWGIPKGLVEPGEELLDVAAREFAEETGRAVEECRVGEDFHCLGEVMQRGGKRVTAWGFEGDWPDGVEVCSNTFPLEWPRGSGRFVEVPEVDEGDFFALGDARRKINPAQEPFLDRLVELVGRG
jgi:predicted NUDIX family NTP pyrophosphohydrolase